MIWLSAAFPFQQIRDSAAGKAPASDSGVLNSVAAVVAALSPLASFPKLSPQALRTVIQPAPEKLLRDRPAFLFWLLLYCFLFLDLCDIFTSRTRKRAAKPLFSCYCTVSIRSRNFVDISWYNRVFFGNVLINGTMVLPHLISPRPQSTLVM